MYDWAIAVAIIWSADATTSRYINIVMPGLACLVHGESLHEMDLPLDGERPRHTSRMHREHEFELQERLYCVMRRRSDAERSASFSR